MNDKAMYRTAAWRRLTLCAGLLLGLAGLVFEPAAADALPDPHTTGSFQRVLSLPGAVLAPGPGAGSGTAVDVFSVLYVFERRETGGQSWLLVGSNPRAAPQGWIAQDKSEEWRHALVLQFTPTGRNRSPAMFFRDAAALETHVTAPDAQAWARDLARRAMAGEQPPELAWVEPRENYRFANDKYLLPILDAKVVRLGGRNPVVLARVASVNAQSRMPVPTGTAAVGAARDMKVGIVFVIDTTVSMKPYIEQVHQAVARVARAIKDEGLMANVNFGLLGFRSDPSFNPRIEYVTRTYHPLRTGGSVDQLLQRLAAMDVSPVSTARFAEDSYAGIHDAFNSPDFDWASFDAGLILLITDAGPREFNDPKAKYPGLTARSLLVEADGASKRFRFSIFALHLLTEEAKRAGDQDRARLEYLALGSSGDPGESKYVAVPAQPLAAFDQQIGTFVDGVVNGIRQLRKDGIIDRSSAQRHSGMEGLVFNELFRAQYEFLARTGGGVPRYEPWWTVDVDLVNPPRRTMQAHVFMNRTQLNGMAQAVGEVIHEADAASISGGDLFDRLRKVSAHMSHDPGRRTAGAFDSVMGETETTEILRSLPYQSDILRMNRDVWNSQDASERHEFIDGLRRKLAIYREIEGRNASTWTDLGGGDPSLQVTLVPLRELP